MQRHAFWLAALATAAGCTGSDRRCGDGTTEVKGVCVPSSPTVCGDGTRLDKGQCVVDPGTCQAGTVLIGHRCLDPTGNLVVDLEESPEPNAMRVAPGVEFSAAPAGTIALKPVGQSFVIHGHITPFRDDDGDGQLDPDIDTYLVTTTAPTLLEISVDGVGGAQGAFYLNSDPRGGAVLGYQRYGLNLTGDTSRRRLFLPSPGRYRLAIADTRTLGIGSNPPGPAGFGGAAGGPSAEYYASITVEPLPTPAAIAIAGGVGTLTGTLATDEVKFFTAALGAVGTDVLDAMPGAAAASVAVLAADQLEGYADETPAAMAQLSVGAIAPGETPLIVVDTAYNYGPAPEPFTLTLTVR